ncbi:MAG TPA: very short patch repair endonuclease [Pseudonocardiaceae bacterium]|nr:very short patch repair endonuclease [Pseudonocardiaceae bacterium]
MSGHARRSPLIVVGLVVTKSSVERSFEDTVTAHRQNRGGAPTAARTLAERARQAAQRRADARRLGRHPAPTTEGRSRNMQAIRRRDTKPEVALRSALHRLGYRFRKDYRIHVETGWVRPDIVFTRQKLAIFVDGCFWHSCPDHGRAPKVNDWYWAPKLARTRERDGANQHALTEAGWRVIRVWEHEAAHLAAERVQAGLGLPSALRP